jgi:hypothetical protein
MIIAALIFVISLSLFLQFFVSYCRSVIGPNCNEQVSEQVWEIAGGSNRKLRSDEFDRFVQLVRLCPSRGQDESDIRVISLYYRLLTAARLIAHFISPGFARWTEREREKCSHFAAIVLDRRINYSRELLSQQTPDPA